VTTRSTSRHQSATGDGLVLAWQGDKTLKSLQGKPVRLKLQVTNGSLYGLRFST
jgi:hypothetical protein